jgi:hypothetical protein
MACDPTSLHRELVAAFGAAGLASDSTIFTGVEPDCSIQWTGNETAQHHTIATTVIAAHNPATREALLNQARTYLRGIDFEARKTAITASTPTANQIKTFFTKANRTEAALTVLLLAIEAALPDE